ncbi:DUF2066 domain-containing protein [Vibrio cholerae]|uniref:DUF2066 domain-containing protein n=1 Tax=Vibrio cholerae TaxID=666 RepID=A0A5C9SWR4_VIBCL|nr:MULTISPECIES: DUF2066 domain-containing protein [Vibrio]EGR4441434.1 DUF2066 domain-containing protein [Vibrio cholerae]EMP91606.1 hypothetical protein VC87395_002656 [Vibrio paracholerae 87395]MCO7011384.1 DUF2066 domain-containing protein [Vibrio paracholerae]MCO7018528.1 DUF2066 domain-containing protein [Vibrio paracholerae]MCO7029442.1 DUF2066 domain-containing protein [Vibrio paracholerae]
MRYLAVLIMGLLTFPAFALTRVNLYQAEVAVDPQQSNADAAARVRGMEEVIVRATGSQDALKNDAVQKALRQSNQYITQISTQQEGAQSVMRLQFSAQHIRSLLSQAQLPFWPESRSNLLVWLVEEANYDRNVSWEHADTPLLNQMKARARVRGLPLTVPVGDFDDVTGVQVSDLWGGFINPISVASQRYPTDAVLVVRAQGSELRWTLFDQLANTMVNQPKAPISGQASGEQAATEMIDEISDYYARKSAVVVSSASSQSVLAQFSPLDSAQDFFVVENKLKRLSSVASLDILKVQDTQVTFNVHLLASVEEFTNEVVRMGSAVLMEMPPEEPVSADNNSLENSTSEMPVDPSNPNNAAAQPQPVQPKTLYFSWQG